jgi:quercetin dioxygenase-like cupin family protein
MTDQAKFIEALRDRLAAYAGQDSALRPFVDAMQDVVLEGNHRHLAELPHPLLAHLDDALAAAIGPSELVESVAAASSADGWRPVYTGEGINAAMTDFMMAKRITGSERPIVSNSVNVGLFLLAADFEYPMHSHAALEVYYVHSGTIGIQNGVESKPRRLQPGEYSVTPSEMPHALITGGAPVLILFVWTGELTAPIWWWVKGEDGNWTKRIAKEP